jgi:hypothetical protein
MKILDKLTGSRTAVVAGSALAATLVTAAYLFQHPDPVEQKPLVTPVEYRNHIQEEIDAKIAAIDSNAVADAGTGGLSNQD